ncbi:DNA polymerase alpha subunit B [Gryllus bimaculatus]|nr:DNA polymerase alpha subunit B [Gryllus bimaculatus]
MVSRDELKEHFSNMGASLTDVTLHKCEELCLAYSVDEEELAETWMAYSCSKSLDIDPTVDALNQMERAEFGNRKKAASVPLTPSSNASLVVYNSALADDSLYPFAFSERQLNSASERGGYKTTREGNNFEVKVAR